jgi:hypothetical protein
MHGTIQRISPSGAPTIDFVFDGATCTAELAGANLRASVREPVGCDLKVVDHDGYVLADLVVNERPARSITENVMDIGCALLWSHWRFRQSEIEAVPPVAATPPVVADGASS